MGTPTVKVKLIERLRDRKDNGRSKKWKEFQERRASLKLTGGREPERGRPHHGVRLGEQPGEVCGAAFQVAPSKVASVGLSAAVSARTQSAGFLPSHAVTPIQRAQHTKTGRGVGEPGSWLMTRGVRGGDARSQTGVTSVSEQRGALRAPRDKLPAKPACRVGQ